MRGLTKAHCSSVRSLGYRWVRMAPFYRPRTPLSDRLLEAEGYTRLPPLDDALVAWDRFFPPGTNWAAEQPPEADYTVMADAFRSAVDDLRVLPTYARPIYGEPYYDFDSYMAWSRRKWRGPGAFKSERSTGIVELSWNKWVAKRGKSGNHLLAGIKVGALGPNRSYLGLVKALPPKKLFRAFERRKQTIAWCMAAARAHVGDLMLRGIISDPATGQDSPHEERDRWIYEQVKEDVKYSAILARLKRIAEENGWSIIGTIPGIKDAAKRYADRHALERPRSRKAKSPYR